MMTATKRPLTTSKKADRLDWNDIKDRADIAGIATALWGPAPKRSGRHLLWRCPFHPDNNPSLQVDPAERRWKCWPCDLGGDAPALVMKLQGVGFPEAVRIVAEMAGIISPSLATARPTRTGPPARPRPPAGPPAGPSARPSVATADRSSVRPAGSPLERPTGLDRQEAERVVEDAAMRLWEPEGRAALDYLIESRGLTEGTIRASRLGWADRIRLPTRDGSGTWSLSGITIPWIDSGRSVRIKVRRLGLFQGSKYIEAFSDGWTAYPSMAAIRPGAPLVIVEGEFDALLLGQELGDLTSVITMGSTSSSRRPDPSVWLALARCSQLFVALDGDGSGDDAAAEWGGRSVRVRPPIGKDWTEALQAGVDLRRWWTEEHFPAEFDRQERAGIFEFNAGMTQEDAERAAGLRPRRGGDA
jgi:DNA primase